MAHFSWQYWSGLMGSHSTGTGEQHEPVGLAQLGAVAGAFYAFAGGVVMAYIGFATYDELSEDQVKELSDAVNALSEPLSKIAGVILA